MVPDTLEVGENSIGIGPLMLTDTGAHSHNECFMCATVHKQGNCSQRGKKCHKCQKMSHFARCCQSTQAVNQVHAGLSQSYAEKPQASGTEPYFLGAVGLGNEQGSPWRHTLNICEQDVSFKIDTGAMSSGQN